MAEITEHAPETTINGMDGDGWSNSSPVAHAPDDVHPDVEPFDLVEPGFTNSKSVTGAKVVDSDSVEDKAIKSPAKKTATRKKA